jgi:UDP-glucuronate 4-epimerase
MSKKVLVTGAAGFIGSNLCIELLKRNYSVVGIDNFLADSYSPILKKKNLSSIALMQSKNDFEFQEFDLRHDNYDVLDRDFDYVVNEAAMPGLPQSWSNFEAYASNNLIGLQKLIEWAKDTSIHKFVQASTSSVYGKNAITDEDGETKPFSPYGVTKLAAENLLLSYEANFELPIHILRYFSVYGPGQRPDMAYARIIESLVNDLEFPKFGDGNQSRSNTFVGDIVDATILAMTCKKTKNIMNICGDESTSLNEVIDILETYSGKKLIVREYPDRPGDQKHTAGINSLAKRELGWQPRTNLLEGISLQYQHARKALAT